MLRKIDRVVWYIGGVSTGTGAVGIVWVNVGQIRSKSYTLKEWVNVPLKSPPVASWLVCLVVLRPGGLTWVSGSGG